ncbi:hypothetical protein GALMADRAFT_223985 [Galerina marginata CBS 339.88]|uniref:Uncharacterized protein n=1 Tax=Galerina marginata (strain CBS 339.88) TaxID=685588 RepID=A0A067TIC6_GALM3|nr:hypothetical protein GALMADRAFT_223985 [Galerina marginata CBS 339.88]
MSITKKFLTPYPPNLCPVSETQAFSGSTTSFSSSSSSTSSAYFDRNSRGSSASAYLTDVTPPISPSLSNLDLDLKDPHSSSSAAKLERPSQPCPSSMDSRHALLRLATASEDEQGYASDDEADSDPFDAVAAVRTKLMRAKPSIYTRRALKIMERRNRSASQGTGSEDNHIGIPPKPMKVVITEAGEPDWEDWSRDFEIGTSDAQIRFPNLDGTIGGDPVPVTSGDFYALEARLEQDFIPAGTEPDISSPQMPMTPIIKPMDLSWDCSPFSLGSPSLSSSNSIYRQIVSPLNLEDNDAESSPAVYDDSFSYAHGNMPLCSPLGGISARMFGSQCNHRSFPVALDGESLGVAALIRLELAGALHAGQQPRPEPQPHPGLGFGGLAQSNRLRPTPDCTFPSIYSQESGNESDFSWAETADVLSGITQLPPPVHREHDLPGPPLEINDVDEQDQPITGLGLGYKAERSLCSSSSVSRLASDPVVDSSCESKIDDTNLGGLADPQCFLGRDIAGEDKRRSEVEPMGALSQQQSNILHNLEHMPISPLLLTIPRKHLPHPAAPNDDQNQHFNTPVIEPFQTLLEKNTQRHWSDADATPPAHDVVEPPQNASTGIDYLPKSLTAEHLDLLDRYAAVRHLSPIPEQDARDNIPLEKHVIEPPALLEKISRVHSFEVYWDNLPGEERERPAIEYPLLTQDNGLLLRPESEQQVRSLVDTHHHLWDSEHQALSPIAEGGSRCENASEVDGDEIDDHSLLPDNSSFHHLASNTTTPVLVETCSPAPKKLTKLEKERIERWAGLDGTTTSLHIFGSECGSRNVTSSWISLSPTRDQEDLSHLGMSRFKLTPENDPRSPCSPAVDHFRQDRCTSGCLTTPSVANSSGFADDLLLLQEQTPWPQDEPPSTVFPTSTSAPPSPLKESKSSKSIDGLGMGLPSDLSSRSLRQRDLSSSRRSTMADDGLSGLPSTTSCRNLAQLADAPSPNADLNVAEESSPQPEAGGSSPFFKIAKFAKRMLYVIPEQPTPSPTLSPCRQRLSTPFSWPSNPPWGDLSVLSHIRSPTWLPFSTPRTGSPSSERGSPEEGLASEPDASVAVCPPSDDIPPAPLKTDNRFKTYFNKITRRLVPESALSPSPTAVVGSPGIIEHPEVPPGLGIFDKRTLRASPSRGEGRLKQSTWKFKMLF